VDTKQKEPGGEFNNGGHEWAKRGEPVEVNTHDFSSYAKGKATPYGVYDITHNEGYVSVGISADTAAFAASSILAWWQHLGLKRHPNAEILTISADSGESNSPRGRLWRLELGKVADLIGIPIKVLHYRPAPRSGTRIEHRLFSFISINWRGKPLTSFQAIINLIGATTTTIGLKVYARLDENQYSTKVRVSDAELVRGKIDRHEATATWTTRSTQQHKVERLFSRNF
jgi:hypothetical protein